uniref:Helicase ATP-binding domain-containing protein n=1 Tax=Megaselia scalaris TaxID=36166 RepID=T1GDC1_MEGSC
MKSEESVEILKNYILKPNISIHNPALEIIPRKLKTDKLFEVHGFTPSTKLSANRHPISGEIADFVEVHVEDAGTATSSMSMNRAPDIRNVESTSSVLGSTMNYPFWPAGFEEFASEMEKELNLEDFKLEDNELLTVPPGFSNGHTFSSGNNQISSMKNTVNLLETLEEGLDDVQEWFKIKDEAQNPITTDVILPSRSDSCQWAEMVDISQPVTDFKEKIPEPALTYPFELDIFQKQAILKLEERKYVFVAAHTSAGKTVVAEYAIALSQKHMTRTIYTSPIKALSNQKYQDFKKQFKDVGLITGDLQIDPTASCLIMTTEILRSMLYCGSEITRDIEYVIFDEVHYINDADRGHVWEEVLILLPAHVQIIMLSATVPNTMELAEWVGNTKQQKVYVISTLKRPVPLVHYLYTGCGSKSKNDIFMIVDSEGRFNMKNYQEAKEKKNAMGAKDKAQGNVGRANPKRDQTLWKSMYNNARALQSANLNTGKERGQVQAFFQKCVYKLKPEDRDLPQVQAMKSSLERGIGIHHSGILPILKEIVEILFSNGLVKILFATETFAMGVNMPARTVIFDSHMKFDGNEVRKLKPSEYIQMAGRAGRRGHDENGTVMILCKDDVPSESDLRGIILGQPEKLWSKFLLRYAMILTCLRIESIKVEKIMQCSFKEFYQKSLIPDNKRQLQAAEEKLSALSSLDDSESTKHFGKFYELGMKYIENKKHLMSCLINQPKVNKELKPGKVLVVSKGHHYNKLAILLNIKTGKETIYKNKHFQPEGIGGHTILEIRSSNIIEITKTNLKVEADPIIRNWEQRQMERFKDAPVGQSVAKAVSDLRNLTTNYKKDSKTIEFLNLAQNLNLSVVDEIDMSDINALYALWKEIKQILPYTNIVGFEQSFESVFERKSIEEQITTLKFKSSAKNLSLYPDYLNKLDVLRDLLYINENDEVTLKGKVACEMGQNELLITELILSNVFNDLDSAEIAALLSGLVFQAKVNEKPNVPEKLQKYMDKFTEISDFILNVELRHKVASGESNRLNFGLIEVVYEWARKKPFSEIMGLTQIQEGIIVRCIQQLDETLQDVKTAAMRIASLYTAL